MQLVICYANIVKIQIQCRRLFFLQQHTLSVLIDIVPFAVYADRDVIERVADVYIAVFTRKYCFAGQRIKSQLRIGIVTAHNVTIMIVTPNIVEFKRYYRIPILIYHTIKRFIWIYAAGTRADNIVTAEIVFNLAIYLRQCILPVKRQGLFAR